MTLSDYLNAHGLTLAEFGARIGVKPQSVHRYVRYGRIPEPAVMARIARVTGGDVKPNDFFDIEERPRRSPRAA